MAVEIIFTLITILYFFTHLYLYSGFRKSLSLKKSTSHNLPKVSVIVAGRNEEQNIGSCINSLLNLNYPKELMEIILVDDFSSDRTLEIMTDLTKDNPVFKVINSNKENTGNLRGKANAINTAIEICTGEIIVSTDADCVVPSGWVHETVLYYSQNTAMVCGFTLIDYKQTLFAKLQCMDWMYLLTLASSSAGLKMILSCLGNNLSYTKNAYLNTGGYKSIDFSVTEDLALMRNMDRNKNYEIRFPADNSCLVKTSACKNLSELFSQKRRWFRGGTGINLLGYIIGFELYAVNFFFIFGFLFVNIYFYLVLVAIKTISELILLSTTFKIFEIKNLYKYYPLFSVYFAFYGLALPLSFLFARKINWKGRKY